MKYKCLSLLIITLVIISCSAPKQEEANLIYPPSTKVDTVDNYFGTDVPDPYRWLEDDNSEQTARWVGAQNDVTKNYLGHIPFKENIKNRLEELYNYERIYAPTQHGNFFYFYKNDGLQNQNVLYRSAELDGEAEVFLDPNTFKEDGTISLAGTSYSEDGSMFSYMISEGGSDWRKAIIIDVNTKEQKDDTLKNIKFSGMSWYKNEGFYYTQYEKQAEGKELSGINSNGKVYFHKIGTSQSEDELIFEPNGEQIGAGGGLTENDRFLALSTFKGTSGNQLFIKDIEKGNEIITIIDHFENDHSLIDAKGNNVLVYTNLDAPNYRLVEIDLNKPSPENWVDVIPEGDNVLSVNTGGGYLFASYLEDAKTAIKQLTYEGKLVREVNLPDIGTAYGFGANNDDSDLYYTFTSFTYPPTIFNYDIESGESKLYRQPKIDFDPTAFETKQIFYESKDGTKVPMFIVHKKGLELNGKMLLIYTLTEVLI